MNKKYNKVRGLGELLLLGAGKKKKKKNTSTLGGQETILDSNN